MKPLTPRQHQIVALMSEGKDRTQIAQDLGVSPHTVKHHLDDAYERLDLIGIGNPGYRIVALYVSGRITPVRSPEHANNS